MSDDEQAIRDVIATWMDATRAGNVEAVLELMTDDVVFLVAGREPMIGKAAFAATMEPQRGPAGMRIDGRSEVREVLVHGHWAHAWTWLTVVATPADGAPAITRVGHTLSVFHKQAGRWRLARDANLLAPATPPG